MTFEAAHMHDGLSQLGFWNASSSSLSAGFPLNMSSLGAGQDFVYSNHGQTLCPPSQSMPMSMSMPLSMDSFSSMDMSFNSISGMQQPSLPAYPSVGNVGGAIDAALFQALQSQLASAGLASSHNQVGHLGMAGAAMDPLQNVQQAQYVEALAQANLQAVVQALLQQKLTAAQQISFLQQLVLKQQDAQSVNVKPSKRLSRSTSGKQRGQNRNNGKKSAPVTGQAPSWADSNWHPLANVLAKSAKGAKESSGTGVFLPGGGSSSDAEDKSSDASSDMSGSTLHLSYRQECHC